MSSSPKRRDEDDSTDAGWATDRWSAARPTREYLLIGELATELIGAWLTARGAVDTPGRWLNSPM